MKRMSETIIFFGSGPVAAESLKKLAQDFEIEGVVTKPKPPHHKYEFPVLSVAEKLGLNIFTTEDRKSLDELFTKEAFKSRLGVVIDYGILISDKVINRFPLGIVNSHFSLLPKWRGADPITFSILSGEHDTGVSLMLIVERLDEGPLLAQRSMNLKESIDATTLTSQLVDLSHEMLCTYLPEYAAGNIEPAPQSELGVSYSRKLNKQDGVLDFNKSVYQLEREIRAFIEWPRSRTKIHGMDVIVTQAHIQESNENTPGKIWTHDKQLGIYASDGILVVDRLIPAGRKEMSAEAFLQGYRLN